MISNSVYSIAIEKTSGRLWIGTTGLERFDGVGIWKAWNPFDFTLPMTVRGLLTGPIIIDQDNAKWIASGGLLRIDNAGVWTYFVKDSCGLPDDNITSIVLDKQGSMWLGTSDSGLVKFTGAANAVQRPALSAFGGRSAAFARMRGTRLVVPLDAARSVTVSVYSLNGTALLKRTILPAGAAVESIDLGSLARGTYAVHIDNGDKALDQKIMVMR